MGRDIFGRGGEERVAVMNNFDVSNPWESCSWYGRVEFFLTVGGLFILGAGFVLKCQLFFKTVLLGT